MTQPPVTLAPTASAIARTERILATAVAVFRLCTLVMVAGAVLVAGRIGPMAVVGAALSVESVLFAAVCLAARRVVRGWAALDVLTVTTCVLISVLPAVGGPPGESPLYGVALMASAVAGAADWPLRTAMALAAGPAAVNVASAAVPAGSDYPVWNAVPDSLAIVGSVLIIWVLCQIARRVGAEHDRQRAIAVEQATLLSRERERIRYADALRDRLLAMLERLTDEGAVPDPAVAAQLRREAAWLRDLVSGAPSGPVPPLADGLSALSARMGQLGLAVTLRLPPAGVDLAEAPREAVLDAVGEALTNVGKHARTGTAEVTVRAAPDLVEVTVTDRGAGYRPDRVPGGIGQTLSIRRRLTEVGGTAEITSAPGAGTTVVLRVPRGPAVSP